MVKIEDKELEEFVLDEGGEIAVPIEIYLPVDGETVYTVYSRALPLCEKFVEEHGDDPFSDSARVGLEKLFTPFANEWGYIPDRETSMPVSEYSLSDSEAVCRSVILDGTRIIGSEAEVEGFNIPLLHKPELLPDDPDDIAAIYTLGDTVACVAQVNDFSEEDGALEINVECALEFRRRGYATSCVARLADELVSRGYRVKYKCKENNIGSNKAARRAGFTYDGRRISFVCYKC